MGCCIAASGMRTCISTAVLDMIVGVWITIGLARLMFGWRVQKIDIQAYLIMRLGTRKCHLATDAARTQVFNLLVLLCDYRTNQPHDEYTLQ